MTVISISFQTHLTYSDITNHQYKQILEVDVNSQLGPNLTSDKGSEKIERELQAINKTIKEQLVKVEKAINEVSKKIKK